MGFGAVPEVVSQGRGSHASFPPSEVDEGRGGDLVASFESMPLAIDAALTDLPVQTNQWWTRLLIEPFGPTIWPYPLAARPERDGLRVFFPKELNDIGTDMHLGPGIALRAESTVAVETKSRADIVLADFETDAYPSGWTVSGAAFGLKPATGILPTQGPVEGFFGKGFVNSYHGGDASTGVLASPPFVIERRRIDFLLGGGSHPGLTGARLLVDGSPVRTATARLHQEKPKPVVWEVGELVGQTARLEIFDQATGGWGHVIADHFLQTDRESPLGEGGTSSLRFEKSHVLRHGDWSLTLRMTAADPAAGGVDFTLGRGMPFYWAEFRDADAVVEPLASAVFQDGQEAPAAFPIRDERWIVAFPDRKFAVHMPPGAVAELEQARVRIRFAAGGPRIVSVTPLAQGSRAVDFASAALHPPRNTRLSWTYEPAQARVRTVWDITLDDPAACMVQGWLPHHWRAGGSSALDLTGPEYLTPRGRLRTASGNHFEWEFPFEGFSPVQPAPTDGGFDPARMESYLTNFASHCAVPPDTYWGGKQLVRIGVALQAAREMKLADSASKLEKVLRGSLADWFSYTPGEKQHYFAYYPHWKALVGFRDSYGSDRFNDHHFHYGYFTVASALLGLRDPSFLGDYGAMATLVAKQYANWERTDARFPFFRTFDIWEGHSHAAGTSGPNGNNQESSSEAMQSWVGLVLLGSALNNDAMRDAGAMGYAMERAATMEYWFNYPAWKSGESNWSPNYKHDTVGILWSAGQVFGTFFSGDPAWIYGIQWLPTHPAMDYLSHDPAFFGHLYQCMWREREGWLQSENDRLRTERESRGETFQAAPNTIEAIEPPLANYLLGFQAGFDPQAASATLDKLWKAKSPITDDVAGAPFSYLSAHSALSLGPREWDWRSDSPLVAVHFNPTTRTRTFLAVNFAPTPKEIKIHRAGGESVTLTVPASGFQSLRVPAEK